MEKTQSRVQDYLNTNLSDLRDQQMLTNFENSELIFLVKKGYKGNDNFLEEYNTAKKLSKNVPNFVPNHNDNVEKNH
jgi:ABC-type lipoprotein release transport system permease subunit